MRRLTVRLTDEQAELLRQAAEESGRSQADLIREGIGHAVRAAQLRPEAQAIEDLGYDPDEAANLYQKVMGEGA